MIPDSHRKAVSALVERGPPNGNEKPAVDASNVDHGLNQDFKVGLLSLAADGDRCKGVVHSDWPPDFAEQFWRRYPRRVAKKAALAALARVRRSGEVGFLDLLIAVERYADSVINKDLQFVAHPSTWLNQGRWDDDPAHLGNTYYGQRKLSSAEGWANRRRIDDTGQAGTDRPRLISSKS